jgi:Tfp pilus assembly protein PilX
MHARSLRRTRGSTLLIVTLITLAVTLIGGTLLRYALVELRLNRRNLVRTEAQNAAESALEYAAAELATRFQSNRNFTTTTLATYPLSAHDTRLPVLFTSSATSPTTVNPDSVVLHVSNITTGFPRQISNSDGNEFDPLRGQRVVSRNIQLLARATGSLPLVGENTVYATQTFEVRDSRLFNYAIFYNLRMEFHPGADMHIWGPVHSNEDFYVTTNEKLYFYDVVSTSGDLIASPFANGRPTQRNIWMRSGNPTGTNTAIPQRRIDGHTFGSLTGQYVDSLLGINRSTGESFAARASQLFSGAVQDRSMGITRQNPPGVVNQAEARQLIAPPDYSSTANQAIEDQKFSRRAGLYILVDNAAANNSTTPRVTIFGSAADAHDYKTSPDRAAWLNNNPNKIIQAPSGLINPDRRMEDKREDEVVNMIDINMGVMRTALETNASASQKFTQGGNPWDANTKWTGAVYVEVENPNRGFTTTSDINVANKAQSSKVKGAGTGKGTRTAVRLVNGSRLPTLTTADSDAGVSIVTNAPIYIAGHFNANGTISNTGAAVQDGSERNADPNWNNGTPSNPNDDREVPALVAGDAINILSANWVDASGTPIGDGRETALGTIRESQQVGRTATKTEISAVLMGGIVETPSSGHSSYSGGVENYPRFHEAWGNSDATALLYRGSIVALFTSQYATGAWEDALYSAPRRRWGYHDFLANGRHPPFTPTLRTYRRLDFRDLTAAEYQALLADTTRGFIEM